MLIICQLRNNRQSADDQIFCARKIPEPNSLSKRQPKLDPRLRHLNLLIGGYVKYPLYTKTNRKHLGSVKKNLSSNPTSVTNH